MSFKEMGITSIDTGCSARASLTTCSDPALALHARRPKDRLRRIAVEHQLNTSVALAQIVKRARHHGPAAIDNRDVIGNLFDLGDLMGGKEHGHLLARHVRDERLQHFLGHRGIEP
jgi:hypothetical protein